MSQGSDTRSAPMELFRSGDEVIAIIDIEGHPHMGVGKTIPDAMSAAMKDAFPEMETKMSAAMYMSLPPIESLPEIPDSPDA